MSEKLKHVTTTRPVFVIGNGRSGTHWIGHTLESHPEVRATIEVQPMFNLSSTMALFPKLEGELFGQLVAAYQRQLSESSTRLYLDKSHTNIWIAEKLKGAFPQSLFVGIERNPYATVASMMLHKGFLERHKRWRELPIPNRLLGITPEMADVYDSIPYASQCAIRWVAHHDRMNELRTILGKDILVISYESFTHNPDKIVHELQRYLGLHQPIPIPDVRTESMYKWKSQLSNEEVMQIQEIVGFAPESTRIPSSAAHLSFATPTAIKAATFSVSSSSSIFPYSTRKSDRLW